MLSIPLEVDSDPEDPDALQAWVQATADEVSLRLLLDTGTSRSSVPFGDPFASRGEAAGRGQGVLGTPTVETAVRIDRLCTGDVVTRDLLVQLHPPGWPHPGLLGMDVLGTYRCDFCLDSRPRIDLNDPQPRRDWFPLTTDPHRTPTVTVSWGHTSVNAVWDTGAGITVVDRAWADRHPEIIAIRADSGHGTDVTGAESDHPLGTTARCTIGAVEFDEQTVGIVDFSAMNATLASPIEVILGLPLIAQATWSMDFPNRRWTVYR